MPPAVKFPRTFEVLNGAPPLVPQQMKGACAEYKRAAGSGLSPCGHSVDLDEGGREEWFF